MPVERCVWHSIDGERNARIERGGFSGRSVDRAIAALAERQHGIVARRQLTDLGLGKGSIEFRVRSGRLHPVHRGVFAVGHRLLDRHGRWLAAALACGSGAVLGRRSAGQLWRIVPLAAIEPEVIRPSPCRRPGIHVVRATVQGDEWIVEDGIPVTTVPRTMLDLAALLDRRELERAWNEMEVRELRDRLSVPDLLARHPGRRGAAKLWALLTGDDPSGITRNDLEEGLVALLDRYGLPRGRMNADLAIRGRFFEIDCLWERQRLAVELDGGSAHRTRKAFQADRLRDRILVAEGWRTMRVTWRQLRDEPEAIAADLRRALA
ncbi:MAG: type IV toxin-antitoxin system AbiEi family antitoxin domain-containing protein [Solirubrobacterales bacterium]